MASVDPPTPGFSDSTNVRNSSDVTSSESLPCPYCLKQSLPLSILLLSIFSCTHHGLNKLLTGPSPHLRHQRCRAGTRPVWFAVGAPEPSSKCLQSPWYFPRAQQGLSTSSLPPAPPPPSFRGGSVAPERLTGPGSLISGSPVVPKPALRH